MNIKVKSAFRYIGELFQTKVIAPVKMPGVNSRPIHAKNKANILVDAISNVSGRIIIVDFAAMESSSIYTRPVRSHFIAF